MGYRTVELMPHHALCFTEPLFRKGPERLARYLAYDDAHRRSLERVFLELMTTSMLDIPITLRPGQHDILCEGCPGKLHQPRIVYGIKLGNCDPDDPANILLENEGIARINMLVEGQIPTIRRIHGGSCAEWERLRLRG